MTTVLVSGAGIAGPSLAYWLTEHGFEVTVVERAAALREGGSAVDFRGKQTAMLEKMGLLEKVRALQTGTGEQSVIDAHGTRVAGLPPLFFSGDVEIERGDLSRILYEHTKDRVEYVFGDAITAIAQDADGVDVTFAHGAPRRFDLLVGADGVHSGVRSLVFAEEAAVRTDLGYCAAGFAVPNTLGLDHSGLIYNEPGRGVLVGSGRDPRAAGVLLVFSAPRPDIHHRDTAAQKQFVLQTYANAGWKVPELLRHMAEADDLYFDTMTQIKLGSWAHGRVALLGDAAWAAGTGGSGTGLAMIGAYVLAGELSQADHTTAFAKYEKLLRPAAEAGYKQAGNAGPFLAPPTEKKIASRDKMYRGLSRNKAMLAFFGWISRRAANKPPMPDYPRAAAPGRKLASNRSAK